jgi:hypothetical protein
MSQLIANYAEAVRRSLRFDPESAQRLASEAEDHLYEALERDAAGPSDEAARRAIRRFGSPAEIIATYTVQLFPERLKATWRSGLLLGMLVVLTMWLRRVLELVPRIDGLPGTKALLLTDAIGFRVAIAAGIVAWLLSVSDQANRRAPFVAHLLVAAAGALGLSVAASFAIASVAVVTSGCSSASLIPMGSTILVCVLMALLIPRIRILKGYAALIARNGRQPQGFMAT